MAYSADEVSSIYNFLKQTPEGNLRKMLIDAQLTDAHFRLFMKLAKGGAEADFNDAFANDSMGKLRLSPKEAPLRETMWPVCKKKLIALGLLPAVGSGPAVAAPAAPKAA